MSDNKDYSIDDILAEFSSFSDNMISGSSPKESPKAPPAPVEQTPPKASEPTLNFSSDSIWGDEDLFKHESVIDFEPEPTVRVPASRPAPAKPSVQNQAAPRHSRPAQDTVEARHSRPVQNAPEAKYSRPAQNAPEARHSRPVQNNPEQRQGRPVQNNPELRQSRPVQNNPEQRQNRPQPARVPRQNVQPERQMRPAPQSPAPVKPAAEESKHENRGLAAILSIVFAVIGIFSLSWVLKNVHPDSGTVTKTSVKSQMNLAEKFDNYANNAASDALSDLTYIPKIYTIGEDVNVAPKPNPNKFGSTTDPQEVMKVIESAAALLDGQEVAFNPDAKFIPGSEIKYYLDDTILAITWKEDIDGKCCSCAEIKIAHGSQIRRKVAGDSYSVGKRYYASDMAKECNSVVAINGDFYDFRQIGVTVFQRQLFRFVPDKLDSCHITSSGDLLFSYAGELYDEEYTKQFIKDNDVMFTLSFGPILIDNGEIREVSSYPIGEITTTYSRSAIGQLDKLHYMLMTVNYDVGYTVAATLNQVGQFLYDKGCSKAYGLDGGQTSVLMMNGECVNHVDYGYERTMSDIIYFATAIPEEEAAQ